MLVLSIVSTKGGVGKTTTVANIGGLLADAGLRVLMLDLDIQPTLSSYFTVPHRARLGIYELLAQNQTQWEAIVSHTAISGLDLVTSNDPHGQLSGLLLHAPDGRLRLRNLLPAFRPDYDVMLIDTQGARSVLLEMAVLACDLVVSPVTPEVLAAREFQRGTMKLMEDIAPYRHLGIVPPPLRLLVNRVNPVSATASLIHRTLQHVFQGAMGATVLNTDIPAIEAYSRASTLALPVHRVEGRRPSGRRAPAALETMRALGCELFPQWANAIQAIRPLPRPRGPRHG